MCHGPELFAIGCCENAVEQNFRTQFVKKMEGLIFLHGSLEYTDHIFAVSSYE